MASPQYSSVRREPRLPATGELTIEVTPGGHLIRGQLLDVSPHGFAIQYDHQEFLPGQAVNVVYDWGKVRARVVWSGERQGKLAAGFRTD